MIVIAVIFVIVVFIIVVVIIIIIIIIIIILFRESKKAVEKNLIFEVLKNIIYCINFNTYIHTLCWLLLQCTSIGCGKVVFFFYFLFFFFSYSYSSF